MYSTAFSVDDLSFMKGEAAPYGTLHLKPYDMYPTPYSLYLCI